MLFVREPASVPAMRCRNPVRSRRGTGSKAEKHEQFVVRAVRSPPRLAGLDTDKSIGNPCRCGGLAYSAVHVSVAGHPAPFAITPTPVAPISEAYPRQAAKSRAATSASSRHLVIRDNRGQPLRRMR